MTNNLKITFLGTSAAIPTIKRNHSSILLSYKNENILIDCGEGTQRQFKKAKISPLKITKLLITHWHGDHVLGIPGFLQTLAFNNYKKTLFIYGPIGTKKFMKEMLNTFVFFGKISIKIKEITKDGKFYEEEEFYLESKAMTHGTPTYAYSFIQKGQIRINKDKLKKSKLPSGPFLLKLKQGKNTTYKGKTYLAKDFIYQEKNKKISFVLDTSMNNKITKFVQNADLLIIEASYLSDLQNIAKEYKHMTAKQAGEIAKKAQVKKLILTHLSPRYEKSFKKILNEAKKKFNKVSLAEDLEVIEI